MNTSSHQQLTRTILQRIRRTSRPSDVATTFRAAEKALQDAGIGFSVVGTANSNGLATAA